MALKIEIPDSDTNQFDTLNQTGRYSSEDCRRHVLFGTRSLIIDQDISRPAAKATFFTAIIQSKTGYPVHHIQSGIYLVLLKKISGIRNNFIPCHIC